MKGYTVNIRTEGWHQFDVESDLSAEEVRERVQGAVDEYGLADWAEQYDPLWREEWAKHPRKYRYQLDALPPLDITVTSSEVDGSDEVEVEVEEWTDAELPMA